ncbi:MAG: LapA family protein [Amphritea sp.]
MRWLKTLLVILLCIAFLFIGVGFALLNTEHVAIDLFFFTLPEASLSLWLMASFVLGGVFGVTLSGMTLVMFKARLGAARRKINAANQELDKLRTASLKHSV